MKEEEGFDLRRESEMVIGRWSLVVLSPSVEAVQLFGSILLERQ
jgi:hypothetical protein